MTEISSETGAASTGARPNSSSRCVGGRSGDSSVSGPGLGRGISSGNARTLEKSETDLEEWFDLMMAHRPSLG